MKMNITRRVAFLSTLTAGVLLAAGFSATPASAQEVIKIGTPLALTGGLADEGKKQQIAYDMWLKRVNAAGGINVGGKMMKVELIAYDYQTNGKRAGQLTEKLITSDKVNFLAAPFGSGHTKITAGIAERYGIPIVASTASSLSVYNQGFKYLFGTLAPNTGMTEAMMLDLRHSGIRVSMVMPGSVDTRFGGDYPEGGRAWALGPDDVASAVLHLLSYPDNALVSRVEMRPSRPPKK